MLSPTPVPDTPVLGETTAPTPSGPSQIPDPIALLRRLTVAQLRQRLDALDAEARALRVLLRSACARERAAARREETPPCSD